MTLTDSDAEHVLGILLADDFATPGDVDPEADTQPGSTSFAWEIVSPGSDLHGEPIEIEDTTKAAALTRARARLADTFSLATEYRKAITSLRFLGESRSRRFS